MLSSPELPRDKWPNCEEAERFRVQMSAVIRSLRVLPCKAEYVVRSSWSTVGQQSVVLMSCASGDAVHLRAAAAYDTFTTFLIYLSNTHKRHTYTHTHTQSLDANTQTKKGICIPWCSNPQGSMFVITRHHTNVIKAV